MSAITPIRPSDQYYSHGPVTLEGSLVYLHPFFPTYETSSPPAAAGSSGLLTIIACQGGTCERGHQVHREPPVDQQFTSIYHSSRSTASQLPVSCHEDITSGAANIMADASPSGSSRPAKWMSSKMRLGRKLMNSGRIDGISKPRRRSQLAPQDDQQRALIQIRSTSSRSNRSDMVSHCVPCGGNAPAVRVCSDCNTTKTPLWRSGPLGPKSLCNACGIRQRKARRVAMASAAPLTGGAIPAFTPPAKVPKEKKHQGECGAVPFKKRCKFVSGAETDNDQLRVVDEFTITFGNNNNPAAPFHRVFPHADEKEAAMLLMALSCGLIRG